MTYANIVTQLNTAAVRSQITVGLTKKAAVQSATTSNQERVVTQQVINGGIPDSWITMVLIELDIAGNLPTAPTAPSDTNVDTVINTGVTSPAVASVWSFLLASRGVA